MGDRECESIQLLALVTQSTITNSKSRVGPLQNKNKQNVIIRELIIPGHIAKNNTSLTSQTLPFSKDSFSVRRKQ